MSTPRKCRASSDGSLPLALLVAIIVAGVVVVLVARTISVQQQVQYDQSFHGVLPAADAGAQVSQFQLNSEMQLESAGNDGFTAGPKDAEEFEVGEQTEEQTRELDGRTFTWFMTRREGFWEVDSTSTDPRGRNDVSRRVLVELRDQPIVPLAAFADVMFNLSGNNSADSYNSETGDWCTGNGFVGSNEVVRFQSGGNQGDCQDFHLPNTTSRTVDGVMLYDWEDNPASDDTVTNELPGGDRCGQGGAGGDSVNDPDHDNCKELTGTFDPDYSGPPDQVYPRAQTEDERQDLTSPLGVDFMEQAFDLCEDGLGDGEELEDFRADELPSTGNVAELSPAPQSAPSMSEIDFHLDRGNFTCYEDAYFNRDTRVLASQEDPVIMFVRGELIFRKPGGHGGLGSQGQSVHVNCENGCEPLVDAPEAGRLWIFVDGGGPLQVRSQSAIAGVFWAPTAVCEGAPSESHADIFGSLICAAKGASIDDNGQGGGGGGQGGWKFHYDDKLGEETDGLYVQSRWREMAS